MLSFEPSTSASAPEGKLFFLGALAGAARAGAARAGAARAGAARAGAARAGAARAGAARAGAARAGAGAAKIGKSLGGITISPSNEKSENNSTTITNDYSTVNYK